MNKLTVDEVFQIALDSAKTERYPSELFHAIIYYKLHRELIKAIQPEVAVELGVAQGGTSLHMCAGCPTAKVIGIDINPKQKVIKTISYIEKNYPNYEYWSMDTVAAAKKMWERFQKPVIGHLYVDGDHRMAQVYAELRAYKRLMIDGAVVVFDDIYLTPDMQQMWEGLPFTEKMRVDWLHVEVGYGFAIWRDSEIRGW